MAVWVGTGFGGFGEMWLFGVRLWGGLMVGAASEYCFLDVGPGFGEFVGYYTAAG